MNQPRNMRVAQYPLPRGRELRTTRTSTGLIVVALHLNDRCISGPLAVAEDELATFRSALADLAAESGAVEAGEGS